MTKQMTGFLKHKACNFIKKETLAQVFSFEIFEISMSTFSIEHLWKITSVNLGMNVAQDELMVL